MCPPFPATDCRAARTQGSRRFPFPVPAELPGKKIGEKSKWPLSRHSLPNKGMLIFLCLSVSREINRTLQVIVAFFCQVPCSFQPYTGLASSCPLYIFDFTNILVGERTLCIIIFWGKSHTNYRLEEGIFLV